jgi:hypothetical protein
MVRYAVKVWKVPDLSSRDDADALQDKLNEWSGEHGRLVEMILGSEDEPLWTVWEQKS